MNLAGFARLLTQSDPDAIEISDSCGGMRLSSGLFDQVCPMSLPEPSGCEAYAYSCAQEIEGDAPAFYAASGDGFIAFPYEEACQDQE